MSSVKKAAAIQGTLIGILWIAMAIYYPRLPDTLASHFGASGQPDGWMSKKAFAAFSLVFPIAMATLLIGVQAGVTFISRMPTSLINMPNKRYWLAPERQAETLAILGPLMSKLMFVIGTTTIGLLVAVLVMTLQTNLSAQPRLDGALPLVLVYVVVVIGYAIMVTVKVYRRFGRVPPAEQGG